MKAKLVLSVLFTCCALFFSNQSSAETIIGETKLSDSATWEASGSPYLIRGNISIDEGAILRIMGGCEIIFEGKYGFLVSGTLVVNAGFPSANFQGKDLGNGKHILWNGIKRTATGAFVNLIGAVIQDCEIAVDFSEFPYLGPTFESGLSVYLSHFFNNLIALKSGKQGGGNFNIGASRFTNNDIAILGDYTTIDSLKNHYVMTLGDVTFESNRVGIQGATFNLEVGQFRKNDDAILDAFYSTIDSSGFSENKRAVSGYAMTIERSVFFLNDQGIIHTGRNDSRDNTLANSVFRSNHFESNKEAMILEDGAMVELIGCNLFFKNAIALSLPDSLFNASTAPYQVEKNAFAQNDLAIQVVEYDLVAPPVNGTSQQNVVFIYNALGNNFVTIEHQSPHNLNFFHNYILAAEFLIDLSIVDGEDNPELGLINYTLSGDTSFNANIITVKKIRDVVKHENFDTSIFSATSYSFEVCTVLPGNALGFWLPKKEADLLVYPNPFQNTLSVSWTTPEEIEFSLYGLLGQSLPLNEAKWPSSPAQFDLSQLPPGIYFLRARIGDETYTHKIIKE